MPICNKSLQIAELIQRSLAYRHVNGICARVWLISGYDLYSYFDALICCLKQQWLPQPLEARLNKIEERINQLDAGVCYFLA